MLMCSMVAGLTPWTSAVERLGIADRQVREHVVAERIDHVRKLADAADALDLRLQRDDDLLLPAAAREVGSLAVVAMARPGVDQRSRTVHVLLARVEMNGLVSAVAEVAFAGRVLVVGESRGDVDVDAADGIHRLLERVKSTPTKYVTPMPSRCSISGSATAAPASTALAGTGPSPSIPAA